MSRPFGLAGLLRFRHMQQDVAAGELSAARGRLNDNSAGQERARYALGASTTDVTSTAVLYAVVAGRASLRSTLSDLTALEQQLHEEADAAAAALAQARAKTIALEKLEQKHRTQVAAEELKAEQDVLDEIASTAWHRDSSGAAGRSQRDGSGTSGRDSEEDKS